MAVQGIKIISDIISIGKSFIPDKDKQLEFEIKMKELEVQDYLNKKGTMENAITCIFPFIGFIFCLYLLSNLIGLWYSFITSKPAFNFPLDTNLYQVIQIYLAGFFGKRAVDSWKSK